MGVLFLLCPCLCVVPLFCIAMQWSIGLYLCLDQRFPVLYTYFFILFSSILFCSYIVHSSPFAVYIPKPIISYRGVWLCGGFRGE
ncbi:hypothetical protein B0T22DRAFT_465050 [Podospora appendiculata]|uniref:Uncharacterized protein n=1 Tax=Podospora appendiculata TaxID=314037 RepID=A0AAE0X560_9PEZI|nr:hypothetical protein B0T22DRAFT_465050 [Podospora appendiculata]